jgi:hypothetical protein
MKFISSLDLIILAFILLNLKKHESSQVKFCYNGTTPLFSEIFIKRCEAYKSIYKERIKCIELYELFAKAVLSKKPCDVKIGDYDQFFKLCAQHSPIEHNRAMFWSGTFDLAHKSKINSS